MSRALTSWETIGKRFGWWVVVGQRPTRNGETRWLVRCECGMEKEVAGYRLPRLRRCQSCAQLEVPRTYGHAGRHEDAVRGTCSWCGRPTQKKPFECGACERQALRRGRDADGRPLEGERHRRWVTRMRSDDART